MFSSKIFKLLCFLTLIAFVTAARKRCTIAVRCSTVEDPVWASDGKSCIVFRNSCFMISENCNRVNNNQKELKVVPKDKCQKKCIRMCPMIYMPVCGIYNNAKRTFSNECVMGVHRCTTGETYDLYSYDSCESNLVTPMPE